MRVRLLLATALALPAVALGGTASAESLHDWCWDQGLGFRVSALVCNKLPD